MRRLWRSRYRARVRGMRISGKSRREVGRKTECRKIYLRCWHGLGCQKLEQGEGKEQDMKLDCNMRRRRGKGAILFRSFFLFHEGKGEIGCVHDF